MEKDNFYDVLEDAGNALFNEYCLNNMNELTARKCFGLILQVTKDLTEISNIDCVVLANSFRSKF